MTTGQPLLPSKGIELDEMDGDNEEAAAKVDFSTDEEDAGAQTFQAMGSRSMRVPAVRKKPTPCYGRTVHSSSDEESKSAPKPAVMLPGRARAPPAKKKAPNRHKW